MNLFEFSQTPSLISTVVNGSASLEGGGVGEGGGVTGSEICAGCLTGMHDQTGQNGAVGLIISLPDKLSDSDRLFFYNFYSNLNSVAG